jgi:hypothetical protein
MIKQNNNVTNNHSFNNVENIDKKKSMDLRGLELSTRMALISTQLFYNAQCT